MSENVNPVLSADDLDEPRLIAHNRRWFARSQVNANILAPVGLALLNCTTEAGVTEVRRQCDSLLRGIESRRPTVHFDIWMVAGDYVANEIAHGRMRYDDMAAIHRAYERYRQREDIFTDFKDDEGHKTIMYTQEDKHTEYGGKAMLLTRFDVLKTDEADLRGLQLAAAAKQGDLERTITFAQWCIQGSIKKVLMDPASSAQDVLQQLPSLRPLVAHVSYTDVYGRSYPHISMPIFAGSAYYVSPHRPKPTEADPARFSDAEDFDRFLQILHPANPGPYLASLGQKERWALFNAARTFIQSGKGLGEYKKLTKQAVIAIREPKNKK